MKDTLTTILLILLAIIAVVVAGLVTIAIAKYAEAVFGRWAGLSFIVLVALTALCGGLLLTIPGENINNTNNGKV